MEKADWQKKIQNELEALNTYKPAYDTIIGSLAGILEERDRVYQKYQDEGARPIIERTSDRGAVNMAKNPHIVLWNELNAAALSYWRELGMTPAGYKKLNATVIENPQQSSLEALLAKLESQTVTDES